MEYCRHHHFRGGRAGGSGLEPPSRQARHEKSEQYAGRGHGGDLSGAGLRRKPALRRRVPVCPLSGRQRRLRPEATGGKGQDQNPDRRHLPPDEDPGVQYPAVYPAPVGAGAFPGGPGLRRSSGGPGGKAVHSGGCTSEDLPAGGGRPGPAPQDGAAGVHAGGRGCSVYPQSGGEGDHPDAGIHGHPSSL